MAELYFNTKSSNTIKMSKTELNDLPESIRKKYRLASESEIKLHEDREAKENFLSKRRDKIEKQKAKEEIANEKAKIEKNKGTDVKPEASSSEE